MEIDHLKEKVELLKMKVQLLELEKKELSDTLGEVEENQTLKGRIQSLIS